MSDDSESGKGARTALAGAILGALIGGIGSFGGAYFTQSSQEEQRTFDVERETYIDLISQCEGFHRLLLDVRSAKRDRNRKQYGQLISGLDSAASSLYRAQAKANLVLDDPSPVNSVVRDLLVVRVSRDMEDTDVKALDAIIENSGEATVVLVKLGREDVRG